MRFPILAAAVCMLANPAQAAIVNGDFSNGLDDWLFRVGTKAGVTIEGPSPRISAQGSGAAARAVFETPTWGGNIFFDEMYQTVTLSADHAILKYDIAIESTPADTDQTQAFGSDTFLSGLTVLGGASPTSFFISNLQSANGLREAGGPLKNTGLITSTANVGAVTTYSVRVDLSQFIGETVEVRFRNASGPDGFQNIVGLDNVALIAAPAVVPLPASLGLLLLGAGSLVVVRRRFFS